VPFSQKFFALPFFRLPERDTDGDFANFFADFREIKIVPGCFRNMVA